MPAPAEGKDPLPPAPGVGLSMGGDIMAPPTPPTQTLMSHVRTWELLSMGAGSSELLEEEGWELFILCSASPAASHVLGPEATEGHHPWRH